MVEHGADVVEEVRRRRVAGGAEQLRQLRRTDRETHTDLDAGQRGVRDVVDDRPEPEQTGRDQDQADEQRQRCEIARRVRAVRGDARRDERRTGEHGDRRSRADRQRSGTAQQRVHDHRDHARVEADLDRKVGDRRVGHRLWDDDGSGGESPDEIACEPGAVVAAQPRRDQISGGHSPHRFAYRSEVGEHPRPVALHADDGPVVILAAVAGLLLLLTCSRTRVPRRRAGAADATRVVARSPAKRSIGMSPFEFPPAMSGRRPVRLQIRTGLGRAVVEVVGLGRVDDLPAVLVFDVAESVRAADHPFRRIA